MTRLILEFNHLRDYKYKHFSGQTEIFFEVFYTKFKRRYTICSTALHIEINGLTSWTKSKILLLGS